MLSYLLSSMRSIGSMSRPLVNGEGPTPCEFLILGEAPGAEEEKQGRPFVGASGQLLDRALDAAGVRRENVYITNAYKYRPPGNRNPTKAELAEHHGILTEEFTSVNPRRVLLLGNVALRIVYPKASVGQVRGTWQHMPTSDRYYLPTWHPSYALRNYGVRAFLGDNPVYGQFVNDVRRFFAELPEHPEGG